MHVVNMATAMPRTLTSNPWEKWLSLPFGRYADVGSVCRKSLSTFHPPLSVDPEDCSLQGLFLQRLARPAFLLSWIT